MFLRKEIPKFGKRDHVLDIMALDTHSQHIHLVFHLKHQTESNIDIMACIIA